MTTPINSTNNINNTGIEEDFTTAKTEQRDALITNINEKIGKGFFSLINKIFRPKRTCALRSLKENLKNNENLPDAKWASEYLPKRTKTLFKNYLKLFDEGFINTYRQEAFEEIWKNKKPDPIGQGGYGTVYESEDGKYALKAPRKPDEEFMTDEIDEEFMTDEIDEDFMTDETDEDFSLDDKAKNEALKKNQAAFDKNQVYYEKNADFITKYIGTFKNPEGEEVCVFEKIDGEDFSVANGETIADQCRFLAQAATAIAISHEAGCINSDVKPENMMLSTKGLKLIDQGALIDLTQGEKTVTCFTRTFCAPEMIGENDWFSDSPISPAADVYSLGITILNKLADLKNASSDLQEIFTNFDENYATDDREEFVDTRNRDAKTIYRSCTKHKVLGGEKKSEFLGLLLQDCLNITPSKRPSAAQVAEILQVFSSYLESNEPDASCPDYRDLKKMAEEDCPKGIPIAIRKMLFSSDSETKTKGISIIKDLVEVDPSYENTPSYGFLLLSDPSDKNSFDQWAKGHPDALKELKERSYMQNETPQNDHQDMPVPKDIYAKIQATE